MATTKELKEYNDAQFEDDSVVASNNGPTETGPPDTIDWPWDASGNRANIDSGPDGRAVGNSIFKDDIRFKTNFGSSPLAIVESPFQRDFFNSKLLGIDLGEVDTSAFNPYGFHDPFNEYLDYEAIRAQKQSAWSKGGATFFQFTGKTLTGALGNLFGGFYGLGSAIADGSMKPLFDNSIYNTIDEWQESIEAKNTMFVNNKDNLGFNAKTAKELSDAFSFIAGAALAEMGIIAATGGLGIAGLVPMLGRRLPKIGKIFRALESGQALERSAMQLGKSVEQMSRINRNINAFKGVTEGARRILTTTGYEAGLEARGSRDEFISKMNAELEYGLSNRTDLNDQEKESLRLAKQKEINEEADKVGQATFFLNTAVLGVSNAIQFPALFGNSYNKIKGLNAIERKTIGEVTKAAGKGAAIKRGFDMVGRILKNPTVEFLEETGQGLVSETSQSYYDLMLGSDTNAGVLNPAAHNLSASLYKGFTETYGTKEGLHEGIIGAIVGAVGIPGFKKRGNKNKFTMHGGVIGGYQQARDRQKHTEQAINSINSTNMSDLLKYNKDNAIIAATDSQVEDLAVKLNDPIALEDSQNNKAFRYTVDRMSKGMEEFIDQDLMELRHMAENDIDTYNKTFDNKLTSEEAVEQVNTLEAKTKKYKEAYKKVHKYFNNFLVRSGDINDKLSNVLTYAVATEDIYGSRLKALKAQLLENNREDFTEEQIDTLIKASTAFTRENIAIDEYIADKKNQKVEKLTIKEQASILDEKNLLKEELDPLYNDLLEQPIGALQVRRDNLRAKQELTEIEQKELANLEKAVQLKPKYDNVGPQFEANKSAFVRQQQKELGLEQLLTKLNKGITESSSKALKKLNKGISADKLTMKELKEYLDKRDSYKEKRSADLGSQSILDLLDSKHYENISLLEEAMEINKRHMRALGVASSIFGYKGSPAIAYRNLMGAELNADLNNAFQQARNASRIFLIENGTLTEDVKSLIEEIENSLEIINDKYEKIRSYLTKEEIKEIDDIIEVINRTLVSISGESKATQEEADQAKRAKKKAKKKESKAEVHKKKKGEDTDGKPETEKESAKKTAERRFNRLTIQTKNASAIAKGKKAKADPGVFNTSHNPKFKSIEELIKDKELSLKDKVTLTLLTDEDQSLPDNNKFLKKALGTPENIERYLAGKTKVEKDESVLEQPWKDTDVLTYVRFAPILLKIEDKYEQYLFDVQDLDNKNADTLIQFRADTLKSENNILDLVMHNVYFGPIENFRSKEKQGKVTENNVSTIGFDAASMSIKDIFYINQKGQYTDLNGDKSEEFADRTGGNTGEIYFIYTNSVGRRIPLKMNSKFLGLRDEENNPNEPEYADIIYDQLNKYWKSNNKDKFFVKNTGIKAIDTKEEVNMRDFLNFFLRNKQSKDANPPFLKHHFSLIDHDLGNIKLRLHIGKKSVLEIGSRKELKSKKNELKEALRNSRFGIRAEYLVKDRELNKSNLDFLLKNKIINHTFSADNFDNIYAAGQEDQRTITFKNPEYETPTYKSTKRVKFSKAYQDLLKRLSNPKNKSEPGFKSAFYNIYNKVQDSFVRKNKENQTKEGVVDSIEKTIENSIALIEEVGKQHPGQFNDKIDHKNNFEIEDSDGMLDKLAKHIYYIRDVMLNDDNYHKLLVKTSKLTGSKKSILDEFRYEGTRVVLNDLGVGKKKAKTRLANKKQFDAVQKTVNLIEELVSDKGTPFIDVVYEQSYLVQKEKGGSYAAKASYNYKTPPTKGSKLNKGHYKTRVISVKRDGDNLTWDDKNKTIKGKGAIYLVTRNYNPKTKKVGVDTVLLLQGDKYKKTHDNTNVITQINIPYMDSNFDIDTKTLKDAKKKAQQRRDIISTQGDNLQTKVYKKFGKDALDEDGDTGNDYIDSKLDRYDDPAGLINKKEYNKFIDLGIVSEERIESIANKIKNDIPLTTKETQMFNDKVSEINNKLRELAEGDPDIDNGGIVEFNAFDILQDPSDKKYFRRVFTTKATLFKNGDLDANDLKKIKKELTRKGVDSQETFSVLLDIFDSLNADVVSKTDKANALKLAKEILPKSNKKNC